MKIPSFLTIFSLIILLLLYGCSTRQSNIPSGIFSYPNAPSAPSEAELYAFVEEAMPPLDRWRQAYEALSAGEQAQVREWLGWYQGLGEEDREMLSYRPGGFGCFFEMDAAAVMEAQSSEVQQVVEENSEGRSQLWWSHFCSLPEYDPKSSQTAELAWLRDFSAASPEERELSSYRPAGLPEAYTELELAKKLKEIDPGVIRAVEEHVFSPGAWWHQYFRQPEVSDNGLESQEKIMNWLLWYTGLSKGDQERADQRTHLFFAAWE